MAASAILHDPRLAAFLLAALAVSHGQAQPPLDPDALQPVLCAAASAVDRAYSLKLTSFVPEPNRNSGVLLQARIDGGPPLHLLLDSGAARITLDARAAARSALSATSESHLVGLGESPSRSVGSGVAGTVEVGQLQFRHCRVDISRGELAEGIDGVIPLSFFGTFFIRLDLPGKVLDLTPYPVGAAQTAGFAPAIPKSGMLFMRGWLDRALEGCILLDTGASYSTVSQPAARVLGNPTVSAVGLRGANGSVDGGVLASGIRFLVAGRSLAADPVVALDLEPFSAFNGIETIGVLGYPALRAFVLTVDYRDALVRIDAPSKGHARRALLAAEKKAGAR